MGQIFHPVMQRVLRNWRGGLFRPRGKEDRSKVHKEAGTSLWRSPTGFRFQKHPDVVRQLQPDNHIVLSQAKA